MHFSNKARLLFILHWCGANLVTNLGKTQDSQRVNYDEFPTLQDLWPTVNFNQTSVPVNMTDCRFVNDQKLDVICDKPEWAQHVDRDQFPQTVRYLHISKSSLKALNPVDFEEKTIYLLVLKDNQLLQEIHRETFKGLSQHLQALIISHSGLRINNGSLFDVFRDLSQLRHLKIEDNLLMSLENVGVEVDNDEPALESLQYLSFKGSDLRRIETNLFWPLRSSRNLTELNLQNCNLSSISRDAFAHLSNLEHVDFYNNPRLLQPFVIYETPFFISLASLNPDRFKRFGLANTNLYATPTLLLMYFMQGLEELNLSENSFDMLGHLANLFSLPNFPPMKSLRKLLIRSSSVFTVHDQTFTLLRSLKHLDLSYNMLSFIPKGVILPSLELLDLSHQDPPPMTIGIENLFDINDGVFQNMTNLMSLNLSHVKLKHLRCKSLQGLDNLQELNLSHGILETIEAGAFTWASKIKRLDLSFNENLHGIVNDTLDGLSNLEYLNLEHSSRAFSNGSRKHKEKNAINLDSLQSLKVLNLRCALNADCTTNDEYASPLDPDYLKSLKELEELDLSENALAQWPDDRFASNSNLKKLSLYGNRMTHLTDGLLASFERLEEINIGDNKLECDEFIVAFVNLTLRRPNITVVGWHDGYGYHCRNKTNLVQWSFKEFYDWDMENNPPFGDDEEGMNTFRHVAIMWLIIVATGGALVLSSFLVGFFIHRERFVITYRLLSAWHRLTSPKCEEKSGKTYDAFISYCNDDKDWVLGELLPTLEKDNRLQCCVHERDFKVGVTVLQNIIDCVDQSQVFIVVLTPGYVNSTWCMFELFLAQSRMMKQTSNLIVVVKQGIKNVARLDNRLQMVLKLWTYLEWPVHNSKLQAAFWQRLYGCVIFATGGDGVNSPSMDSLIA